jgi:glycosyltransferase involved in cell wall biosynthesis
MDLTVCIPARNEEWLSETLEDLFKNIRGNTEVIVILDGAPAVKPLPTDPRLTVIHHAVSVGQRAATNNAVKLSRAKFVMKVDAHCAFDEGFDVKMIEFFQKHGDNITAVPIMRNLHVFNWKCEDGHTRYQSPSGSCSECGKPTEKEVVWTPKANPQSTSYRFDTEMHFQYFHEYKRANRYRRHQKEGFNESMSLQGSCFMLTRDKYWELNICDEEFGSWGAQGTEVACKTWLSGGRVLVNHSTWYAHLFRTKGGDFSFPYPQDNKQVEQARKRSQVLFLDNTWPQQIRPLSWLVESFKPVPGWHDEAGATLLPLVLEAGVAFTNKRLELLGVSGVVPSVPLTVADHTTPVSTDGRGEGVAVSTGDLPGLNGSSSVTQENVVPVGNESEVLGVTASSVATDMVENRNVAPLASRDGAN